MKNSFAYIRVSTVKQGEHGVSLQEQRSAIEAYAVKHNINITQWFEERATAAKNGRPIFNDMMKRLHKREAEAVIIHKIDRSARNLRDWAALGELNDAGIEFHFAVESLDLTTRGGRLAADIQAVVAADYIRNLASEARKGFYGRLKQGFYPLPAPVGYIDNGAGKDKTIDPIKGPQIKQAFILYATGDYSLKRLQREFKLTNKKGWAVSINGWSRILNNPFYYGLIYLKKTDEVFKGSHEPIISKELFETVQAVLKGKSVKRTTKHEFLFQKQIHCKSCGRILTGEKQKERVYYRCHNADCEIKGIREDRLDDAISLLLEGVTLMPEVEERLEHLISEYVDSIIRTEQKTDNRKIGIQLSLDQLSSKLNRLTDAFIEGLIDEKEVRTKKAEIELQKESLEKELSGISSHPELHIDHIRKWFELCKSVKYTYENAIHSEKRKILQTVSSNYYLNTNNVDFKPSEPWMTIENSQSSLHCAPCRDIDRTFEDIDAIAQTIFEKLLECCETPNSLLDLHPMQNMPPHKTS